MVEAGRGAERRHLTVLWTDLATGRDLTSRLGKDKAKPLVLAYQDAVDKSVARFGGYVLQRIGASMLICFNWPKAQEAPAKSAVLAAQ